MNRNDLEHFRAWFSDYCRTFIAAEGHDARPYAVKEEHTRKVCDNVLRVAESLALDEQAKATAETVALFHDAGRFPQYRQYRTFRDSVSVNHAALGAKVLLEQNVLAGLSEEERKVITHAVTLHNVFTLPDGLDEGTLLQARLIRDADKLDIWRIFIEYYDLPDAERSPTVGLELPDTPGCSPEVIACVNREEMGRHDMISIQNDFKLLQLSWVFDLNFPCSFCLVNERGYVDRLAAKLPATEDIRRCVEIVKQYVSRKMK